MPPDSGHADSRDDAGADSSQERSTGAQTPPTDEPAAEDFETHAADTRVADAEAAHHEAEGRNGDDPEDEGPVALADVQRFLEHLIQFSVGQRKLPLQGFLDHPDTGSEEGEEAEDGNESGTTGEPAGTQDEPILDDYVVEPVSTHATLWPLTSERHWELLHKAFASDRERNLRPWFRCLGLLRGLQAKCVVVETYYVCLDYKSEHASFYGHLDAPLNAWAVRLHFFSETIDEPEQIVNLQDRHLRNYLGYIVCREGNLPLVGRTLIRLPDYLGDAETTAIDETVNFFGQKLSVRGVPFMQQDVRFANCSHVALWIIAYSAYRRGTTMRRLIADLVAIANAIQPLRPRVSEGLFAHQVVALLAELGFRADSFQSTTRESLESTLPAATWWGLPDSLTDLLLDELGYQVEPMSRNLVVPITRSFSGYVAACNQADYDSNQAAATDILRARHAAERDAHASEAGTEQHGDEDLSGPSGPSGAADAVDGTDDPNDNARDWRDLTAISANETFTSAFDPQHPAVRAVQGLLDNATRPYVRSGLPVYLGTYDHALVLCARKRLGDRVLHFVHDDQTGPYLVTESLPAISKEALLFQSGVPVNLGSDEQNTYPPLDPLVEVIGSADFTPLTGTDADYGVSTVIIPTPARVLLPAGAAIEEALSRIGAIRARRIVDVTAEVAESLSNAADVTAVILMGIDYKMLRREMSLTNKDDNAVLAFSAVQLPEWVVVVEGSVVDADDSLVTWECVFDASSSEAAPRILFARVLNLVVTAFPRNSGVIESMSIATVSYPRLKAPAVVGKMR